jgi:hypothetical protein
LRGQTKRTPIDKAMYKQGFCNKKLTPFYGIGFISW